jgi:hypothetical protein
MSSVSREKGLVVIKIYRLGTANLRRIPGLEKGGGSLPGRNLMLTG